jgi:hypothetical protein
MNGQPVGWHSTDADSELPPAVSGWNLWVRLALLLLIGAAATLTSGQGLDTAPGEGFAIFVIFGILLFMAVRRRNLRECAPFVALGVYSLLYAILVAAGRAPEGYNDWFLTSRYTTSALCLYMAVLGLCLVLFAGTQKSRQLMLQAALIGFIGLGLANSIAATSMANEDYIMRRAAMRLLVYQNLFHAELDGCGTGPFFTLCPVGTAHLYAVNRRILQFVAADSKYGFDDLMKDLLLKDEPVAVEPYEGYWLDIGRPDDYMRAIEEFEQRRHQFLPPTVK